MKESMTKITMPGLMPVDFEMRSANKSTPPGLICSRSISPTPIPMMIPPRIAFVMTGKFNNPFKGANQSIMVEVKTSPIIAFIK